MTTHYERLNLPENASAEDIKAAYRARLKQIHPDLAADKDTAHALTQEVIAAYEVLSDRGKRAAYDAALRKKRASALVVAQPESPVPPPKPPRHFAPIGLDFSTQGWLVRLIIGFLVLYLCAAVLLMLGQMG